MEKVFIGIDISKLTLDIYVKSYSSAQHYQIENNTKAIAKFLNHLIIHPISLLLWRIQVDTTFHYMLF